MTRWSDCTSAGVPSTSSCAADQAQHAVAQVEDEPHVVLDDDDREPAVPDLEDQLHRLLGLLRVHPRGRLVEEEELRVRGEGSGDLEPSLVAVGHVAGEELGRLAQPDVVEQLLGPLAGLLLLAPELRTADDRGDRPSTRCGSSDRP